MSGLGVVWIPLRLVYPSAKWTELPLNAETPGDCDHYPSQGARPATGGFVDEGPTEIPTWAGEHNHGHMVTAVPQHLCRHVPALVCVNWDGALDGVPAGRRRDFDLEEFEDAGLELGIARG